MNSRMTNEFTDIAYNTSRNEKPQYVNFAASKMSQSVKPNTLVEFTDFMGRKHKVAVRNNTELKKKYTTIKQIISQYHIKLGKVEKRFIADCKRELKQFGLTKKAIDIVLG